MIWLYLFQKNGDVPIRKILPRMLILPWYQLIHLESNPYQSESLSTWAGDLIATLKIPKPRL